MFGHRTWISIWVNELHIDFWKFQLKVTHAHLLETYLNEAFCCLYMPHQLQKVWQNGNFKSASAFFQFQIINVLCLDSTSQMTAL